MFAPAETGPRILGIDPGLTRCGYAVLDAAVPGSAVAVSIGVLRSSPDEAHDRRLGSIHADVEDLLDEYAPSEVAIERVFFQANTSTAMAVAQVSGVVTALAARRGLSVTEYTPSQVKSAVAGWGGAEKRQIRDMVRARLSLSELAGPADAADAAAIALCHLASSPFARSVSSALGNGRDR